MRTRKYILEATERIIQAKGLARLTNKEIAREAGCTEATLYNHFDTKEALILAAIEENLPSFIKVVQQDRVGKGTIEGNLRDIALATIDYYRKLVPLSTALFADMELLAHYRQWMQEQQRGPLKIYGRVAAYVEGEQHIGRLSPAIQPFAFASLLLGACFQYVYIQCFQGQDPFPLSEQQYATSIVQMLLLGHSEQAQTTGE